MVHLMKIRKPTKTKPETLKVIVAGPRDFDDYDIVSFELIYYLSVLEDRYQKKIEIVQGGAKGVDSIAKDFARNMGYPCKQFDADWTQHGRYAGPLRNQEMAQYSDVLIAFNNGSKGTANMIKQAIEFQLEVIVISLEDYMGIISNNKH